MSAESPNRTSSQNRLNGPITVTPQHVTDPTILDSVAGFINEVVPTTYNVPYDTKDQIQWAHFEQLECDETTFSPNYDCDKIVPPPLILVLGYTTGIQIWLIPANGEATEILSWRHGSVRVLRLIPAPYVVGSSNVDLFAFKRPLIALCDTATPGSQFCSLTFLSLKTGEQVKLIKFKNAVLNVLANKRSVVVTFSEKIAIFDAFTLEDRLTITTCYLSPGLQPNPVALGQRWLAFAEKKLNPSKRSSGGNEGEGIQSYTATVLHAAKSLGRGLRELGETVASSLTGNPNFKPGTSPNSPQAGGQSDVPQKGIITILDIEVANKCSGDKPIQPDAVIAHFTAHTEAIVCLEFDPSGLLLLTADKRGHDFHLFRIQPHPAGSSLAAIHHLYILHRGDTSARVQDMCFSPDSRWITVSTLRGTTHVFPVTPYGGNVGVRTHATPHVVNKMSRFHRSAGLTAEGRSNSPVSLFEAPTNTHFPFHNPRFSPFPHPTLVQPLAQIRQPVYIQNLAGMPQRQITGRQRLSSSSEENIALRVVACFAAPRAWIDSPPVVRETTSKHPVKAVESLFIMSCHGTIVQYDLEPRQASSVPKEKVFDDTPIELSVCAKAQWLLQRQPNSSDIPLPMSPENLSYIAQNVPQYKKSKPDHNDDHWLSQVEIVTHAGPHRRLWMGPQFTFKTYTTVNGTPMSVADAQALDLGRSKPVNMPITKANAVLIESSSASSCEQSLLDTYQRNCEEIGAIGELQLKEDLADAMLESPGIKESGGRCVIVSMKPPVVAKVVNPLGTVVTVQSDDETEIDVSEDAIIHENCDEALFRPVVASKNVLYAEFKTKSNTCDEIITKSLESTTEVAVKILNKSQKIPEPIKCSTKSKIRDISPKSTKCKRESPSNQKDTKLKEKSQKNEKKINETPKSATLKTETKLICDFSDPFSDVTVTDSSNLISEKKYSDFDLEYMPPPTFEYKLSGENNKPCKNEFNFDLPPLENDDFFSLENISKNENFEDARDCEEILNNKDNKFKQDSNLETSEIIFVTDKSVLEEKEKSISKKIRKPKTKLGVKIATKENISRTEKTLADCVSDEVPAPLPPKKSWSSVAATNTSSDDKFIKNSKKEQYPSLDLPNFENDEFLFAAPPAENFSSCVIINDLISIDTPREENTIHSENILEMDTQEGAIEDLNLLKISDDEKQGSSPAETTESDDSSKIPQDVEPIDDRNEETLIVINTPSSKSSKRKLKKKRK